MELGAPLFISNEAGQTPCDLAEGASMTNIAQYLESKMVFYVSSCAFNDYLMLSWKTLLSCSVFATVD